MLQIQLKVKNTKEVEFLKGFLRQCPVPRIEDPPGTFTDAMTTADWINEWVKIRLLKAYEYGKQSNASDTTQIDRELFE